MPVHWTGDGSSWVNLGLGVFAMTDGVITIEPEASIPYSGTMRVQLQDGRFVVTALELRQAPEGPPITSDGLRAVPIAALIRGAAHRGVILGHDEGFDVSDPRPLPGPEVAANGPTPEALRAAAVIHRYATVAGIPPKQEVAKRLGLTVPTAGRWLVTARREGLIDGDGE
jgi:hypothetical protein